MATKTKERTELKACECGCGKLACWNHLHMIRSGLEKRSFFVLDGCRKVFQTELDACDDLRKLIHVGGSLYFWQRFTFVNLIFNAQMTLHQRLRGQKWAFRNARRIATLYLLPQRLCLVVTRFWTEPA